jgi:hypothetical protein
MRPNAIKAKPHDPLAPHQAIITINCDIMENLPSGHVSGFVIKKLTKLLSVKGKDYEECLKKAENLLQNLPNPME